MRNVRTRKKASHAKRARSKSRKKAGKRWSKHVTEHSNAMDLRQGVFKSSSPKKIAASLKRAAERSKRRKAGAYRSALSMLTFYINRAGKNLPVSRRKVLQRAKTELREQFGRD